MSLADKTRVRAGDLFLWGSHAGESRGDRWSGTMVVIAVDERPSPLEDELLVYATTFDAMCFLDGSTGSVTETVIVKQLDGTRYLKIGGA